MKEKIERFSKGDFEYELPFICLSEDEIVISAEAGKKIEGSFTISNNIGRDMKGVVYSSSRLMNLREESFQGIDNTIHYEFNATFLKEGEIVDGEINIVSDSGEKSIPFSVQTHNSYHVDTLGKIKDLFQFTNLARTDWSEAKKVFRSEDFERIFLKNEERYKYVYRNLIRSISTSQALEEFLVAIHKKSVIRLEIDKTQVEYQVTQKDNILDKLVLSKNNWGYAEIRVSTDAAYIQLEQKILWADRFTSNQHQITYSIDTKNLQYGNHYGHIFIKTAHQTIAVEILCKKMREESKVSGYRYEQKIEYGLVDNYLSFRLNRINLIDYLEETEAMMKQLPDPEYSRIKELMKIHMSIVAGRVKIAEDLLMDLASEEVILKKNILEYCAYQYLKALFYKDEGTIRDSANVIRSYYEKGNNDWRILWLLLNTDKRYENNKLLKLSDMKEQFDAGCHSPILYFEAVCIYNEEPYLLRELNEFEIQILNFGIKNWILSRKTAQQYTYLTNKKKNFNSIVFKGLEKLYDEYGTIEILTAICCMLIKGMKRSEKYFEWYRLGVEAQLRITELYEYYMYSIKDTIQGPLAQPVLLYFIYNSNLSDKKKAYLYANIVRNKDRNEPIYRTYNKKMEVFATKMLEGHHISRDLAVLYKEFFGKGIVNYDISKHLPYVMYRNELVCNNPNISNVIVFHKEVGEEENITLVEGKAQVDIYTNKVEVFLVDSFGNRYVESIDYSVTPYLNSEEYESYCIQNSTHPMLLLHLYDRYQSYRIMNDNSIALRKKVFQMEGLSSEHITFCCQTLIEYYYDNYNDEQLEYYLGRIDLRLVRSSERSKFIEILMFRSFYDKALEALETYGLAGIGINRLVKLCSGWMLRPEAEMKLEYVVYLCHYVFTHNKYDEVILKYLVHYYNGPTKEMFLLWKAAKTFEINTYRLEERLLTQILFSESYIEDGFLVFATYYKNVTNHRLVRAFLSFFAYKFLVHNNVIDTELFPIMKRELYYEENDICLLAWLKYNSTNNILTENELVFAEYNIQRLYRKGITLPFFLDYKEKIVLPDRMNNKYFITYHSDPRKQVYIHYRLKKAESQEYTTERMTNIFLGIHSKEFFLFYHETVQYYITEDAVEGKNITESFHTICECDTPKEEDSKYNRINLMLLAQELQEDNALLELMDNYVKQEYMIENCFKLIE